MLRGFAIVSLDDKGRLAIPARYRERLISSYAGDLVFTINPMDRSVWLYPLLSWQAIEVKLAALSDFDKQSRRTKQMMQGYASDCRMDGQGRVLLPQELRNYARINKQVACLGQGNKFELWDEAHWTKQRDQWLSETTVEPSDVLKQLSL